MDRTMEAMGTRLGPDLTLNDVVSELDIAKPTFYRFFDGKSDLFWAIVDKVRDDLSARVPSAPALLLAPVAELTRMVLSEMVSYVDANPAVIRFVLRGQFSHRSDVDDRPQADVSKSAAKIVAMLQVWAPKTTVDMAKAEFHLYALLSACGGVCDWWLGSDVGAERTMPHAEFIDHLISLVTGSVSRFADDIGAVYDPDRLLAASFSSPNT
ncbi:TetR/AcrR family transcriptional regulator [Mycobacteroides chelonae]|nr:TetR/AcrR family transcriptional regulator [Mycobacteroides chelonae]QQG86616.1 TetR/AcrR family transcriptional regulator [Mycobacteroides chelonae]QQG91433.1 TetR/AcrR family transcriptional regulator [Mycobacteroides chelonae]